MAGEAGDTLPISAWPAARPDGARILEVAGRPIKTLGDAKDCDAGANEVLWNAPSDRGLPVPNGVYLV